MNTCSISEHIILQDNNITIHIVANHKASDLQCLKIVQNV